MYEFSTGGCSPTLDPNQGYARAHDVARGLQGPPVKLVRRALAAVSIASVVGALLRLRGRGGVPPQEGGWKELRLPPRS